MWLQRRQASTELAGAGGAASVTGEGGLPAEQHFPGSHVVVHGVVAATTVVLVLLAALNVGS